MTERAYMSLLTRIIDHIFTNWDGNLSDFARSAGLSPGTVRRLFAMGTRRPQFRTLARLAEAAGVRVSFGRHGARTIHA